MLGRNDCKHCYSACASGRSQGLALLANVVLACVSFPIIVHSGLCSNFFMVMLGIQAPPSEPNDPTPLGVRCRHSPDATAQELPTPESQKGNRDWHHWNKNSRKAAVDVLKAGIAGRKALEEELEDWRMKGWMMPVLLKATKFSNPGTLPGNASPLEPRLRQILQRGG